MEKKTAYAHAPSVALHAFRALAWLRHPLKRRKKKLELCSGEIELARDVARQVVPA